MPHYFCSIKKTDKKMNSTRFVITKESLSKRLFAASAHMVRARESMGIPPEVGERMLITADELKTVEPLIDNSINNVFCSIESYHPGSSIEYSDNAYIFIINTPGNYPAENGKKLKIAIESYIINHTLHSWYTGIKPDEASIIAVQTQNDATTIQQLLMQRTKPNI